MEYDEWAKDLGIRPGKYICDPATLTRLAWQAALANDQRRSEQSLTLALASLLSASKVAAESGNESASETAELLSSAMTWVLGESESGDTMHEVLNASLAASVSALKVSTPE